MEEKNWLLEAEAEKDVMGKKRQSNILILLLYKLEVLPDLHLSQKVD